MVECQWYDLVWGIHALYNKFVIYKQWLGEISRGSSLMIFSRSGCISWWWFNRRHIYFMDVMGVSIVFLDSVQITQVILFMYVFQYDIIDFIGKFLLLFEILSKIKFSVWMAGCWCWKKSARWLRGITMILGIQSRCGCMTGGDCTRVRCFLWGFIVS